MANRDQRPRVKNEYIGYNKIVVNVEINQHWDTVVKSFF